MLRIIRWLIDPAASQKGRPEWTDQTTGAKPEGDMAWFFPPGDLRSPEPWDRYWSALCVGSGISQEPHALAAAGLDVTALDISPFAMRFASGLAFEPANAGQFFDPRRIRSDGIVKFAVGNLLDSAVCSGRFDVIIERRTLQLFSEHERPMALGAVVNRLSPHGILLTHCHDGGWKPPAPPVMSAG